MQALSRWLQSPVACIALLGTFFTVANAVDQDIIWTGMARARVVSCCGLGSCLLGLLGWLYLLLLALVDLVGIVTMVHAPKIR